MRNPQHEPERRCIISGERAPKEALTRLALGPDDMVLPDIRAKAPGRGAWLGVSRADLEIAIAKGKLKGALSRAFKAQGITAPDDLPDRIEAGLERNALDRLGLEARSGTLITGSDKIDESARRGKVRLLLHAQDAGIDGNRKLDQAWRIGSDAEGSGKLGLVLGADRNRLSAALGRDNVVHIAITDAGAAARVASAVNRWHFFVGRQTTLGLAESSAKVHGDAAYVEVEGNGLSE